jgi:acyl-coenzyme A synthetase/AMP-(fatty) acid ligase
MTSKPKLVLQSHQSYPVGHLSTEFHELRKTLSGKIRRVELRQRVQARTDATLWPAEFREADGPAGDGALPTAPVSARRR